MACAASILSDGVSSLRTMRQPGWYALPESKSLSPDAEVAQNARRATATANCFILCPQFIASLGGTSQFRGHHFPRYRVTYDVGPPQWRPLSYQTNPAMSRHVWYCRRSSSAKLSSVLRKEQPESG